jgi:tellurium resistance protein TerD
VSVVLTPGANTVLPREAGAMTLAFSWRVLGGRGPLTEPVAAAIVCGADGHALSPDHVVFFNELTSPSGAVRYVPKDETERIEVDLAAVPSEVDRVVFLVYINPDPRRPGSMVALRGLAVAVVGPTGTEVARFALAQVDDPAITALLLAELYRHNGWWKVRAIGQGFAGGIADVARAYGLRIRTP